MTKLDMFWLSNPKWHKIVKKENGKYTDILTSEAPPEAVASYNRYIQQISEIATQEAKEKAHIM